MLENILNVRGVIYKNNNYFYLLIVNKIVNDI